MAGDAGLEPTHARVKVWCLTNLANPQKILVCLKGVEPLTPALEGRCSIQLSYRHICKMERVKGIEPSQSAWKAGALPLSYTRMLVEGAGFEPAKALPTDLQSAPFSHSGIPP